METNRISQTLKMRRIEFEIITLFPILEFVLGMSLFMCSLLTPNMLTQLSIGRWDGVLIAGSIIGMIHRKNLYIYYIMTAMPLQFLSGDVFKLYQNSYHPLMFVLAILLMTISIASSIFAGKVIPRGRINGSAIRAIFIR